MLRHYYFKPKWDNFIILIFWFNNQRFEHTPSLTLQFKPAQLILNHPHQNSNNPEPYIKNSPLLFLCPARTGVHAHAALSAHDFSPYFSPAVAAKWKNAVRVARTRGQRKKVRPYAAAAGVIFAGVYTRTRLFALAPMWGRLWQWEN